MVLVFGVAVPAFLSLLVSFVLLAFASWCVGEGGEILGARYDASIVGGLLIAWLNTSPEAIFFVTALRSRAPRFAMGAMSGSAIVVSTIALGTILYMGAHARKSKGSFFTLQPGVKNQCLWLLSSCTLPFLSAFTGFHGFFAVAGVLVYLAFLVTQLLKAKQPPLHHEKQHHDEEVGEAARAEEDSSSEEELRPTSTGALYLLLGGILILAFAEPFISSVSELAASFEVNPILLAFFLAPVASEMPEILESISLSRKGKEQTINVAFSNLVGGTVTKTTLLVGLFAYYGTTSGFQWETPNYPISLLLMASCAATAAGLGYFFPQQRPWMAHALLGLFVVAGVAQYATNGTRYFTGDPLSP